MDHKNVFIWTDSKVSYEDEPSIQSSFFQPFPIPFYHIIFIHRLNPVYQISHKLQPILSPLGIYWGSLNKSQTSEQSLSAQTGVPLCTLSLVAMFRFIWADIRPENDLSSQRSLPSHFVGVWTSWAPLYSLAG